MPPTPKSPLKHKVKRAKDVIDFCKRKGIDYHIKFGTREEYNQKTENLFKGN